MLAKRVNKAKEVETVRLTFKREGVIGKGSFGVVQLVRLQRVSPVHGEGVEGSSCSIRPTTRLAMKTVAVKQKESRELGILKQLDHPNIVPLRFFFFSNAKSGQGTGTTLNLLFDAQPTTVYDALGELASRGKGWSGEEVGINIVIINVISVSIVVVVLRCCIICCDQQWLLLQATNNRQEPC